MTTSQILISLVAGISLAAACGLRVFVPLLAASFGARAGLLHPSSGFVWITSPTATMLLAVASVVEIAAFLSPWIVHALDVIAAPAAAGAGVVAAAVVFGDIDPALKWTAATIAGAGSAGTVHIVTTIGRVGLSGMTAGGSNRLFGLIETLAAAIFSALTIALPVIAAIALLIAGGVIARIFIRRHFSPPQVGA
jgi:hypothetical protein